MEFIQRSVALLSCAWTTPRVTSPGFGPVSVFEQACTLSFLSSLADEPPCVSQVDVQPAGKSLIIILRKESFAVAVSLLPTHHTPEN